MRSLSRRGLMRRLALLLVLLLGASFLDGCTWWEQNVTEKVKGLTRRRLVLTSDPPGADVFINDVYQGKTPLTLTYSVKLKDLMKGFEVLVQKKGYLPLRREVSFRTRRVTFRLIRRRRR